MIQLVTVRLLPIFVQAIDHFKYNEIDKHKLFIQAYRLLEEGFDYNLSREEVKLLNDNTDEFEQVDSLEELFLLYFTTNSEYGVAEYSNKHRNTGQESKIYPRR